MMTQNDGASFSPYTHNIVDSLRMHVHHTPHSELLVDSTARLTYKDVWERTNRLGQATTKLGVKKGDRVALLLNNTLVFPEMMITAAKFGWIVVPINRYLKSQEIAYLLQDASVSMAVLDEAYFLQHQSVLEQLTDPPLAVSVGGPHLNAYTYQELLQTGSADDPSVKVAPDDIQMILYTSGTTGRPKGAVRAFADNYHTATGVCIEWGVRRGDVQLAVTPLYHAASVAWMLATFVSGGKYVVSPQFDPLGILQMIEKEKINWMMMVPIMYDRWLSLGPEVFSRYDLSSLKTLISGGAPLHTPTKQAIKQRFPAVQLYEFYGSTELGVSTSLRDEDQLRLDRSVGRPMPGVELSIRDQHGNIVPQGEIGLLYSRGLSGFRGYWNDPIKTKEAFIEGGWATVGDLARQDHEGNYYIVDRAKDMIITGGVNVYPVEVEEVLLTMPEIADVAVIGIPDERWGEAVLAIVVPRPNHTPSAEEIIQFCKERLASFKAPKAVKFVEVIPRTASGKILKNELRKEYWPDHGPQIS